MGDDTAFSGFIRRIRAGDEQAARELVARYEPVVRREVKMRLRDPRLYRMIDWTDVCQSVMASFFLRAASGQYELDEPGQLMRLLVVMTRHKLSKQERRHRAGRRDYRLVHDCDPAYLAAQPGKSPTPSRVVAGRELLEALRSRLSGEERMLADLRAEGCEWAEISHKIGGTAQGRRMQLARAVRRVERQLESCEARHE